MKIEISTRYRVAFGRVCKFLIPTGHSNLKYGPTYRITVRAENDFLNRIEHGDFKSDLVLSNFYGVITAMTAAEVKSLGEDHYSSLVYLGLVNGEPTQGDYWDQIEQDGGGDD